MSRENVEVVRRAFDAFRRRDWQSFMALFDPDIEWHDRPESGLGTFHGRQGVMRFFQAILEAWEHFDARADDIIDAGDQVVVLIHQTARGSASGVDVEERLAQVLRLRGGKVCYTRMYTDRREALEAVGLGEEAMSRENGELVRQAFDAFNRRDLAAFLSVMAADVEFTPYERALEGLGPYRGHDGVRTWWQDSFAAFPDFSAEVHEVRDLGAVALVRGRLRGQGAESGAFFERTLWQVLKWRDRKIVWWRAFENEAEAVESVGLRE